MIYDQSLRLEFGSLEPCTRVEVAAQGEAAVVREAELGSYFPQTSVVFANLGLASTPPRMIMAKLQDGWTSHSP